MTRPRGRTKKACGVCGKVVALRFEHGNAKARVPHKCPHGVPCVTGDKLLGMHANNPPVIGKYRCDKCTQYQKQVKGQFNGTPRPVGCWHKWRTDRPCASCACEAEWNKTPILACGWCGSGRGYEDQGDGWPRCRECGGC